MIDAERQAEYVRLVTDAQRRLYAYILTLVSRPADADDVLQETNVVLWAKADQFAPGSDFNAWAATIARYQALAHLKRHARGGWLHFDGPLVEKLADTAAQRMDAADDRRRALVHCLAKLPPVDRDLIAKRYDESAAIEQVAQQVGRSVGAVKQALYRIRGALMTCIERTIASGAVAAADAEGGRP